LQQILLRYDTYDSSGIPQDTGCMSCYRCRRMRYATGMTRDFFLPYYHLILSVAEPTDGDCSTLASHTVCYGSRRFFGRCCQILGTLLSDCHSADDDCRLE
jgi:hypothetical protein